MKIEAVSKDQGLHGGREVWFHVFSHEVYDWPSIEKLLSDEQRRQLDDLGPRTLSYYPHSPLPEEREEHGYLCEDFFVWSSTKRKKSS